MSGLLRRLTRRRPATADENPSPTAGSAEPAAAPADAPAETGGDRPLAAGGEPATTSWGAAAASADPQAPAPEDQPTQLLPQTGEQAAAQTTSPGAEWAKTPVPAPQPSGDPPALAQPAGDQPAAAQPTGDQPTAFAAQPAPSRDLPAGVDAGDLTTAPPASARRGKLRRRLRYLRNVRELLLRDLGGFTYEVHRTAGGTPQEAQRKLSAAKANRIAALDAEVGAIEARLGEPHAVPILREAGIGGTCPECGELHASDAHFCSRCGAALDPKVRAQRHAAIAAAARPMIATPEAPDAQPASVLWAGGPRPAGGAREDESRTAPSTSEWLAARDQPTTFDRGAQPAAGAEEAKAADEPSSVARGEPKPADEPPTVAADEPKPADEPPTVAADEPKPADEPPTVAADEPKPADEPPTPAGDQPKAADEPASVAGDEPKPADEPANSGDEPTATGEPATAAEPPAKPKRRPRAKKPPAEKEGPDQFEPAPNGRRDEDVPPPMRSGDPLATRRERPS